MAENPHEKRSAAPIDNWAEKFKSYGLTEQEMRTAVKNQKARMPADEKAAQAEELKKQKVRRRLSACPALRPLCSV